MKKSTTLFLLLMYLNAFSQTDCSNAIRIINSHNYTPSAGNPIASGPFYDCIDPASGLSATWFTLLACKSASSESIHINASSDSLYAVIWGPFSSSLNSCNQLTQTNMIDCDYEVWYQWVLPSLSLHLTNIQAGDIYYIMVASGDSINGIEIGLKSPGSISPFTGICGLCNNSVAIMSQELCLITVDTASSYPKIIWEESGLQGIASSTIFRESSVTGVWDSLATIPVTSLSEYIDSTANTLIKKWSYRISANDSCDNRRISTASHSTMHLQIYPGINGYMNLSWTIATGYQNNPVLN